MKILSSIFQQFSSHLLLITSHSHLSLTVVYPLEPLRSTTHYRSYIMVLFIWCYSFTFSIVPALNIGLSKYVPEGFLTSCSFDYLDKTTGARIFMFIFFIFAWFIPFIIITYCYTYILKAVLSSRHMRSNKNRNKIEMKLSIIVVSVIILWFVAWTPYAIVALLGISGNEDKITPLVSMIPAVFCKASACINPYIYSITHPKFRSEFSRLCMGRNQNLNCKTSYYKCNPSMKSSTKRKSNRCMKSSNVLANENFNNKNVSECKMNASNKVERTKKRNKTKSVAIVAVESRLEENVVIDVVIS